MTVGHCQRRHENGEHKQDRDKAAQLLGMLAGDGITHLLHDEILGCMRHFPLPHLLTLAGKTSRRLDGAGLGVIVDPAPIEEFQNQRHDQGNNSEAGLKDLLKPEDRGNGH